VVLIQVRAIVVLIQVRAIVVLIQVRAIVVLIQKYERHEIQIKCLLHL
jgi:hypothetical protein